MKAIIRQTVSAIASLLMISSVAEAAQMGDFTITNRATGQPIRRADFDGKILFLDFFAYWCGPCQASSPIVEAEIAKYYEERGGNAHGVEVRVIGVNIESANPAATDQFIANAGLKTVANDYGSANGAWAQLGTGGIPHFAIINGTKGGSHAQWEILHSAAGFNGSGSAFYRGIIDSVSGPAGPEIAVESPVGNVLVDGVSTKKFGKVAVGKTVTRFFTIKNTGTAKLTGVTLSKSGAHKSNFMVSPLAVSTINPGTSVTVKVKFQPIGVGYRTATLRIRSNDTDENPFDIRLTGQSVYPPI